MVLEKIFGKNKVPETAHDQEKRDYVRLVYPPDKRPVLTVGENSFEVLNICRTGLKFLNHLEKEFSSQVFGKVRFQNGGSIKINGKILWETGREIGLFVTAIPDFIIKQEIRTFVRREANADTLVMDGASLETAREEISLEDE